MTTEASQSKPGGNTKTPGPKNQLYLWMITLKYENDTAEKLSQELNVFCKKYTFQKEKGKDTGYVHWQIFISLKQKEYFNTVKNLFPSSAHIEPVKDGWKAEAYCRKEDSRVEGPYNEKSIFLKIIKELRPWQAKLELELTTNEPNDRTVIWYHDETGLAGKTQFSRYMNIKHNATLLMNGSSKDLAYALGNNPKIVLICMPRNEKHNVNYGAIESIKDGLIFSAKYESSMKIFNSPHVVVFANDAPILGALSKDRWDIRLL